MVTKNIIIGSTVGFSIVAILAYLITIPGVVITGSSDIYCAGTTQDPCVSYFNITSNLYTLKFYNMSKNQKLDFSPDIKDYQIYKLSGTKWIKTNFPINMTKGVKYQFKLVGYKNNPIDTIKWGVGLGDGYLDPTWYGTVTETIGASEVTDRWSNYLPAFKYVCNTTGELISIGIELTGAGTNNFRLAVYNDNAGKPANLLAETGSNSMSTGWNDINLTGVTFNAGTTYWLSLQQGSASTPDIRAVLSNQGWYVGPPWSYGAFPANFSASPSNVTETASMRVRIGTSSTPPACTGFCINGRLNPSNISIEYGDYINLTTNDDGSTSSIAINTSPYYFNNINTTTNPFLGFSAFASYYNFSNGNLSNLYLTQTTFTVPIHTNSSLTNATLYLLGRSNTANNTDATLLNPLDATLDLNADSIFDVYLPGYLYKNGTLEQFALSNYTNIWNMTYGSASTKTFTIQGYKGNSYSSAKILLRGNITTSDWQLANDMGYVRNNSDMNFPSQFDKFLKYNQTQGYAVGINGFISGSTSFNLTVPDTSATLKWHFSLVSTTALNVYYMIFNYNTGLWESATFSNATANGCSIKEVTYNLNSNYVRNNRVMLNLSMNQGGGVMYDHPITCEGEDFSIYSGGFVHNYFQIDSLPSNIEIKLNGYRFGNYTVPMNNTQYWAFNNATAYQNVMNACVAPNGNCTMTISIKSSSAGLLEVSNMSFTTVVNPIYFNLTKIKEKQNIATSNLTVINITVNANAWGIGLNVTRLDWFYYNSVNYTVKIINTTGTFYKNISVYFTNYTRVLPYNWTNYTLWYPTTNNSKNVTPYGQTDVIPIYNITGTSIIKDFNLGVRIGEALNTSCLNMTFNINSTKSNQTFNMSSSMNYVILTYLEHNSSTGIWMWLDMYNCDPSLRVFTPNITFKTCCSGCYPCW